MRRFWQLELLGPRLGFAQIDEVVFAGLAAIFGILPLIDWFDSFRRAVLENLSKVREARWALPAENSTFGPPENVI